MYSIMFAAFELKILLQNEYQTVNKNYTDFTKSTLIKAYRKKIYSVLWGLLMSNEYRQFLLIIIYELLLFYEIFLNGKIMLLCNSILYFVWTVER